MLDPIFFVYSKRFASVLCLQTASSALRQLSHKPYNQSPGMLQKQPRPLVGQAKGSKIGESLKISKFPCMEIKVCCCLERGIDRITFLFPPFSLPLSFFLFLLYLSSFSLFNENQRGYSQLAGSFLCACCVRARRHTQHPCQQQRRKHLLLRPQHLQASFLPLRIPIASRWIVAKGRASGKP